jgi:hypothetical protein
MYLMMVTEPAVRASLSYNYLYLMKWFIYCDSLMNIRGCILKFPDWVDNEINNNNNNKHSRSNTKNYGGKTHYTDPQNSDTTAPSGRDLYH